jgi:hypothetical protein
MTKAPLYKRGMYQRKNPNKGKWLISNTRYRIKDDPNSRVLYASESHLVNDRSRHYKHMWQVVSPNGQSSRHLTWDAAMLHIIMTEYRDKMQNEIDNSHAGAQKTDAVSGPNGKAESRKG